MLSSVSDLSKRCVKVFTVGHDQVVRIPREFEFLGTKTLMRKEGERLILEPVRSRSLLAVLDGLEPLDDDLPDIPDPPIDAVDR